jgi:hypothetical protein
MRVVAILCLALMTPGVAVAAVAPSAPVSGSEIPPGLVALMNRPDHQASVLQAARAVDVRTPDACPNPSYAPGADVEVLVPLSEGPDNQPLSGVWKESLIETGCGVRRTLNTLTMVEQGGRLVTRPLLPGSTITDPQLQQDSIRYAAAGLGPLPSGCKQGAITDTDYIGMDGAPPGVRPAPGAPVQPWSERWTLQACSKRVVVGMHFTPGPDGGTEIQASPPPGQ